MVFETDEEDDGFDDIAKFTTNESCVSYDEDEEVEDDEKTLNVNLNHTLQSFSLGIGLGISIASGAITVIGLYIYDQLYYTFNTSRESLASPSPFYDAPSETSLLNQFSESVLSSLPRIGLVLKRANFAELVDG
ncbi:hypothetical protein QCA50_018754 [Cerrena zonata]|uniref:Uncharacterized protein n=1 Tax=Cerrena zonata TaxID=2478898 RepID=A0AAW0FCK8_9APHY